MEIILGYFSLLLFMAEVALMGWYIFSKYRVEKMRQLKVERSRSRNVSRDQVRFNSISMQFQFNFNSILIRFNSN